MYKHIITLVLLSGLFSWHAMAEPLELQDHPPERYTVVKGDTLWGISGRFLKQPWRWPEIWKLNRNEIKNPNLIYPGDAIVLDMSSGSPRLRLVKNEKYGARETDKLSPRIRVESTGAISIPVISPADIGPFLSQPLIIEENGLESSPEIIGAEENRVVIGAGNRAYVHGLKSDGPIQWQLYRPGKALLDPDSQETLGYEAIYLGEASVTKFSESAIIEITKSTMEINVGDRLVAPSQIQLSGYVPHAPEKQVHGKIISAYGGVAESGTSSIVTLNKGSRDGIEAGHVMAISRQGAPKETKDGMVNLPEERYGLLLVFRVFDKLSYALIVQAQRPVLVNDVVETP